MSTTVSSDRQVTRRFEFVGGNSAKFWQVTVAGTDVTVRFGRLGTEGQEQTKEFPSAEAATGHTQHLVAQKAAKGCEEVASALAGKTLPPIKSRKPALSKLKSFDRYEFSSRGSANY